MVRTGLFDSTTISVIGAERLRLRRQFSLRGPLRVPRAWFRPSRIAEGLR